MWTNVMQLQEAGGLVCERKGICGAPATDSSARGCIGEKGGVACVHPPVTKKKKI